MSFITSRKISEAVGVLPGIVSADGSGGVNTPWVSMAEARQLLVHAQVSAGTVTVQFQEAENDDGDGSQSLGSAVEIDGTAGVAEVASSDLSDGFTHVRAVVTASGANPTSATVLTAQRRFNG